MTKIEICIPAYNEALILKETTRRVVLFCEQHLSQYDWQLVLVINGSKDASGEIAQTLAQAPRIKAVIYTEGGRGRALRRYWLSSDAEIVSYMDSDLAVNLEALPPLLEPLALHRAELSIGTRFHKDSRVRRSYLRGFISWSYNFFARLLLNHRQSDLQCGFKAFRLSSFKVLATHATDPHWFFDTELIAWANRLKLPVAEVPVEWEETRLGKRLSKVRLLYIPFEFIWPLVKLRRRLRQA